MTVDRLLILDDDPRILDLVVAAGERVRYAVTPTEAISQFRQAYEASPPSLIVVDLQAQGGLGRSVVAEGVKNRQLQQAALGIEHCQGFGIACPMPSDRVLDRVGAYTPPIAAHPRLAAV